MVDRNSTVAGNYAKKFGLLSPLPATDAGANRRGHRNRLTRQQLLNSSYRLPSQDDSDALLARNPSAFAVSRRHALAVSRRQTQSCSNFGNRIWKSRPLV